MASNLESPKWLGFLERYLRWLAIPNLAIILVTLQVLGFLLVTTDPIWLDRLALYPGQVLQGEYWRLITFLSLPLTLNPFWVIFGLWFLYFILDTIEREWGAFKTTFYVLVSIVLTIAVSFALDLPVLEVTDLQSTLFLAAAALFPEFEVRLFFIIPVKMRWLGWLTLTFLFVRLFQSSWDGRFYLLAIYSNYCLFFGPVLVNRIRQWIRRENFKKQLRR